MRLRHPHFRDGEYTQMVEDGFLETDGSVVDLEAFCEAGLDEPDVEMIEQELQALAAAGELV